MTVHSDFLRSTTYYSDIARRKVSTVAYAAHSHTHTHTHKLHKCDIQDVLSCFSAVSVHWADKQSMSVDKSQCTGLHPYSNKNGFSCCMQASAAGVCMQQPKTFLFVIMMLPCILSTEACKITG